MRNGSCPLSIVMVKSFKQFITAILLFPVIGSFFCHFIIYLALLAIAPLIKPICCDAPFILSVHCTAVNILSLLIQ